MSSKLIAQHLEQLKNLKTFDGGFIDVLIKANETGEDAETTAGRVLELIRQRYAQSKEHNT